MRRSRPTLDGVLASANPGKLIIICGLPGSGKTTASSRLQKEQNAVRLCPDDWMNALAVNLHDEDFRARVETLQWQFGKQLLVAGLTVIVEWGTWGRHERDALRTEARALGTKVELHYLAAPIPVLFECIRRRNAEDPPISRDSIDAWANTFEIPTKEELALYNHAVVHESDS